MPQTLEGTCPALPLDNGCKIIIEALDTNGASVTGVTVTNVNIYGLDLTGDTTDLAGPFMWIPGPETTTP